MAPKASSSTNDDELQLAFITISDQSAIKDPAQQQLARTQAIKHSLQRKRRQLQLSNNNFVEETPNSIRRRKKRSVDEEGSELIKLPQRSASFSTKNVDPFDTLTVNADRLTSLLRHSSAQQAGEPIFSVNDAVEYQGIRSVFHAGLEDGALTAALCLTLAFAANGGTMDQECLAYRSKAIQLINEKLSDPAEAASNTTVGTVLLLLGVEERLGERDAAQVHLNGTRQLLQLCNERKVYLSHALKRAIFWQDLFSSIVVGTYRVFSHEIFPEMHWHRDPFQETLYSVPPGFAIREDILGHEFLDIVKDICALQRLREAGMQYPVNAGEVEKVDNQQAWIESRLQQLRTYGATEPLLICCIPAAYLCAYGFFAEVWSASLIPSRLSAQLLQDLQTYESWNGWDDHSDLLLWLLNIGAAFATDAQVRLGFAGLWHGTHRARLESVSHSWDEIEEQLKSFIWSDVVYAPRCGAFWKRLQSI